MDVKSLLHIHGFLISLLIWLKPGIGSRRDRKERSSKWIQGFFFPPLFSFWKLQLSLCWTWDRAWVEQDPVSEGEHRPEGGGESPACRSFFFSFVFLWPGRGSCGFLRAGMMRPNRGFILLLLNGTACLVRKMKSHDVVCMHSVLNHFSSLRWHTLNLSLRHICDETSEVELKCAHRRAAAAAAAAVSESCRKDEIACVLQRCTDASRLLCSPQRFAALNQISSL